MAVSASSLAWTFLRASSILANRSRSFDILWAAVASLAACSCGGSGNIPPLAVNSDNRRLHWEIERRMEVRAEAVMRSVFRRFSKTAMRSCKIFVFIAYVSCYVGTSVLARMHTENKRLRGLYTRCVKIPLMYWFTFRWL